MKLNSLIPVLYAEEIAATIKFYTAHLDFTCDHYDKSWGWASLSNYGVELVLSKPNTHFPFEKAFFTGSFYFRPDDVDALWKDLKDKVHVCYPIENFEYGMHEFAIYDNNGYIL